MIITRRAFTAALSLTGLAALAGLPPFRLITDAVALIPGFTLESVWSSVSVAAYETTLLLVVPTGEIEVTWAPSWTPLSASGVTVAA